MSRNTVKGTAVAMPLGIMFGAIISVLITCLLAAILTWLTTDGKISNQVLGYCIMGSVLFTSIFGAAVSAKAVKRRRQLVCWLTGIVYYLILLATTGLFFGGHYQGLGVSFFLINLGSLTVGTILFVKQRHHENSYERYRNR